MEFHPSVSFSYDTSSAVAENAAQMPVLDERYGLSDDYIRYLNSEVPVAVLQPGIMYNKAREFVDAFPGHVMYAVKCNPDEVMLQAMYAAGVKRFDVASLYEVKLIRRLFPFAHIYFMHPIKSAEAIREAYHEYRVRAFVLDHADELDKILEATNYADDLELFVRIAVPKGNVATDFSAKFGAKPDEAAPLLARCAPFTKKLGLSFHVGTQCTDTVVYSNAVKYAAKVIADSGANVQVLDVGGGFPTALSDDAPPPLAQYMQAIASNMSEHGLSEMELLCEAGRGLVADAGSLVVRVEGRKGDLLYLNDGTYGGLFEAGGSIGLPYPARLIRRDADAEGSPEMIGFRFAGPTCDSVDMMKGPFMLPADVRVGDWISLNKLGAYGEVSRTNFNGFGKALRVVVQDLDEDLIGIGEKPLSD